jgi:hypothetical protein
MIMRDDTADNTYEGHLPDCEQYAVCETCDCAEIKLKARIAKLEKALNWYGVQVYLYANGSTRKADEAAVELDQDGAKKARAALKEATK